VVEEVVVEKDVEEEEEEVVVVVVEEEEEGEMRRLMVIGEAGELQLLVDAGRWMRNAVIFAAENLPGHLQK
jgi:hypothetical protein